MAQAWGVRDGHHIDIENIWVSLMQQEHLLLATCTSYNKNSRGRGIKPLHKLNKMYHLTFRILNVMCLQDEQGLRSNGHTYTTATLAHLSWSFLKCTAALSASPRRLGVPVHRECSQTTLTVAGSEQE